MENANTKERAKELRREYARKWRAANPDKVKAANERYWLKLAEKEAEEAADGNN